MEEAATRISKSVAKLGREMRTWTVWSSLKVGGGEEGGRMAMRGGRVGHIAVSPPREWHSCFPPARSPPPLGACRLHRPCASSPPPPHPTPLYFLTCPRPPATRRTLLLPPQDTLDAFKRTMPLITDLRNPAMRDRHWASLQVQCSTGQCRAAQCSHSVRRTAYGTAWGYAKRPSPLTALRQAGPGRAGRRCREPRAGRAGLKPPPPPGHPGCYPDGGAGQSTLHAQAGVAALYQASKRTLRPSSGPPARP